MAKKKGFDPEQRKPSKIENPFIRIPYSNTDQRAPGNTGGGAKILVTIDDEYRLAMSKMLTESMAALAPSMAFFPDAPVPLILKLRETGIAKTHRPTQLIEEAGVESAGHANIDEMLVAGTADSMTALREVILHRNVKNIRANLSAIEKIEPWSVKNRNPEGVLALRSRGRALINLFSYSREDFTVSNYHSFLDILEKLGVQYHQITRSRGLPLFSIRDIDKVNDENLNLLLNYPGARSIFPEPVYRSHTHVAAPTVPTTFSGFTQPNPELPTVAIFDTGVSGNATHLNNWVVGRDVYVLPPDTNYEHGTMVASLVVGANQINGGHPWFPKSNSFVYDVCGLEAGGACVSELIERLREAVGKRPDIKIWNLSLGCYDPCDEQEFSEFSIALDELSDQHNVLFIVAAGNYLTPPRRTWPNPTPLLSDRISSPGDSVRSLTVASISHIAAIDALSSVGHPTPYSRRGPGPVFTPKPDLTHVGGGVHNPWNAGLSSIFVLGPSNNLMGSFGTSFSAPIASSMAANLWGALNAHPNLNANSALVKALMIHSAQLVSPDYTSFERRYYGAGKPDDVMNSLFDSDDSFTLIFEAQVHPGLRWRKSNYPIPQALIHNGKFRGEIIITAVYSPPLDPNAGSEYVRANVELSFGVIDGDKMNGKVPMEGEEGQNGYEKVQIENGGKWSPVKVHRKSFPNGIEGDVWGIQASVVLRAFEAPLTRPLPVSIIVTLRSLEGNPNVYADGLRALAANNWVHNALQTRVPLHS